MSGVPILLTLLVMLLGSCAAATDSYLPQDLGAQSEWRLIELDGEKPIAGSVILLSIDQQQLKVSGSAGCNRFMSSFKDTGQRLEFGSLGLTKRYCGKPLGLMQQESKFVQVLQGVNRLGVDGERLVASGSNGTLVFVAGN